MTVTVDGSNPQGQAIAEEFMDYAWETRDFTTVKLLSVAEAVALARRGQPGDKPLVVADYTDNPGGGGYGDATAFLKGLVEAGVDNVAFHAICDPEAVQQGMRAGIGAKTTLALGGKTDPAMGGPPLALFGEIVCLTNGRFIAYGPMGGGVERNYGPSMVFRVGGIDIVVITNNGQATDLAPVHLVGRRPDALPHGRGQVDAALPRRLRADRPRGRPRRHRRPVLGNLHLRALHPGPPPDLAARPDLRPSRPVELPAPRSLGDVEAEIEDRRAVGDPAARDQVDAGCGDGRCGFEGNSPRGFGDGAAVDHRHRPAQRLWIHVVEQYGVDPHFERLGELVESVDLELDLDEMAGMAARPFERLRAPRPPKRYGCP